VGLLAATRLMAGKGRKLTLATWLIKILRCDLLRTGPAFAPSSKLTARGCKLRILAPRTAQGLLSDPYWHVTCTIEGDVDSGEFRCTERVGQLQELAVSISEHSLLKDGQCPPSNIAQRIQSGRTGPVE
jgi:hypothetical protein